MFLLAPTGNTNVWNTNEPPLKSLFFQPRFFHRVQSQLISFVPGRDTIPSTAIVFEMLATETKQQVPDYTPPTNPGLKIPLVVPGKSDGRVIEGDFPLDQIVIDRKHFDVRFASWLTIESLTKTSQNFHRGLK